MQKPKEYDWKDSNMALFGSDTDKKVKKESAQTEPAWTGAGEKVGIKIWRIVKFQVTDWEDDQYGEFYNGDSYIILNTYKEEDCDALLYDVHFWIGKYSSQDEYGTAAYKTVELDTFLDDRPIQHREVQGHESSLFKGYFEALKILKGGADTGFKRVLPEAYKPRLFQVRKGEGKNITCTEVPTKRGNLKSADVFIIDNGATIYQWNGKDCSHDEKFAAAAEVSSMKSKRGKAKTVTLEEKNISKDNPALKILRDGTSKDKVAVKAEKKMFAVSDADGSLDMDEVAVGDAVSQDLLKPEDVYIIVLPDHCYCWVGSGANIDERKNAMAYACNHLSKTETPWLPITVIAQGSETEEFKKPWSTM